MARTKQTFRYSGASKRGQTGYSFSNPFKKPTVQISLMRTNTLNDKKKISVGQAEAAISKRVRNSKRLGWLREIRHYQQSTDPIIPRVSFQRLVKEISQDYKISSILLFISNLLTTLI